MNDNDRQGRSPGSQPPERAPDRLAAEVRRLQALAERASLEALAHILAMAAGEASRVADWERRILTELNAGQGGLRRHADCD